ncbi:MAG TPA: carboxypeptidase-like regulatory domain-containing protein, partial [Pyrinomonadaceae bacterium]|nr:carboxypeptidase-like regulatory domain-containing protein [Pyrinomonadaceae bacterium]
MKGITVSVVFLLTLLCCVSITANAQSDRGSIVGTVKDPNGAVVSKAKVTVTSLDSGEVREVETSDDGNFTVAELKAAPYKMTVQATGFKTATIDSVRVAVQVTRRQDVNLEVGNVGESVLVTSDSQTLQTESPVQQTNVTERQVRELPLQIGSETAGR